jgi:hypothetical protein
MSPTAAQLATVQDFTLRGLSDLEPPLHLLIRPREDRNVHAMSDGPPSDVPAEPAWMKLHAKADPA